MPQTIAIQRGTSTIASGSGITLFTQSGGLSTRVIPHWITWRTLNGANVPKQTLNHVSSTGAAALIGYNIAINTINSSQNTPTNNAMAPLQTIVVGSGSMQTNGTFNSGTDNWFGLLSPAEIGNQPPNQGAYSYLPSNFWIGPSDSLRLSHWDNSNRTVTVAWSFTTITES